MVEVIQVDVDEWATVRNIRLAALRDSPDWFWNTYGEEVEKPESWWRNFMRTGAWFIAYEQGRPVGIVAAIVVPELEDPVPQLISMWVEPGARRNGVGKRLVDAVKGWAHGDGARELRLCVTHTNHAARRLYERCGFEITGHADPLPRQPSLIEQEMRLRL